VRLRHTRSVFGTIRRASSGLVEIGSTPSSAHLN
jgi:hypothetical protein